MLYKFTINDFEGPLDLLLNLIQKKEKDIIDIDVSEVAKQYVSFIKQQQEANLEIASEYLVMASYLIELKSKAVLPLGKFDVEGSYEESQKQKLIDKLIEYKKFKNKVNFFKESFQKRQEIHTKEPMSLSFLKIPLEDRGFGNKLNSNKLSNALSKMFKRISSQTPINTSVGAKPINLEELELRIINKTRNKQKIKMSNLFDLRNDKAYIVATIVCILDLTKNRFLQITQVDDFGEIILEGRGEENE